MSEPTVVTVGAGMFADAVAGQAVAVDRVDWRPPMPGTEADLVTVATDPRRPEANRKAVEAMLGVTAHLVDVAPASEVLGLEPGQFLHAGPPIEWAPRVRSAARRAHGRRRAGGPRRRPRGRRRALRVRQQRQPGAVPPPQRGRPDGRRRHAVDVDVGPRGPGDRQADVLLAQRGPRQGAALRRVRPRGAHPAALDGRRARAAAPGRGPRHRRGRPTSPASSPRCCRWATRPTTATAPAP